ncbi:MAG: DNA cytosine methyltransferase [Faecalibacterium sp.]
MKKYNVLDLFCGCGGLSKGFENAGFQVLLGVDNDNAALYTFEKNHKNAKTLNADLSAPETFDMIEDLIGNQTVDVIVGGPPCQGFSLSGPRNFEDERNKLYLAMINTVEKFSPKAFVIENVPGMGTLYNGAIKEEIVRRFTAMGYTVRNTVMCAADYGVPQMRKRLIFVGIKNQEFVFPIPQKTAENYLTCYEALSDLPSREDDLGDEIDNYPVEPMNDYQELMRKNQEVLYNHVATNHTQMVKDVIALVPEGGNYKDLPEGVGTSRKFNEAWTRYHSQKPSKTIDTGHRNHFHYQYNRVPTIRENARLQSFADDFIFYGTRTQQNRQVGNAVPPLLGQSIAEQLLHYMEKE